MVESLGWGSPEWRQAVKLGKRSSIAYLTTADDLLAAGDLIMCKYLLKTDGHEEVGVQGGPVLQHGMMQCKFGSDHRMVSVEMVFDVMGFMQQLQRASGMYIIYLYCIYTVVYIVFVLYPYMVYTIIIMS
jgi:hypothetical protein